MRPEMTQPRRWSEKIHHGGHRHRRGRPRKDPVSHVEYAPPCYTDTDVAAHVAADAERQKRAEAAARTDAAESAKAEVPP